MLDERIRRRIEALNRGPLPKGGDPVSSPQAAPARSAVRPGRVPAMPGLVRRGEAIKNQRGEHLRVRLPLDEIWPGGATLANRRIEALKDSQETPSHDPSGDLRRLAGALPNDALLIDLEACGLAGAALFLIGVLRTVEDCWTAELLLARDYSEEPAVLTSFWQLISDSTVLVTFNGKSFDWPMVLDRTIRHRLHADMKASDAEVTGPTGARPSSAIGLEKSLPHVDLLHHARRRWKSQLPDCKLQTLERAICGRRRDGDLPGSQIPGAYEQFVRTGFEREMDAILLHNAIDLVTLLDLSLRLAA